MRKNETNAGVLQVEGQEKGQHSRLWLTRNTSSLLVLYTSEAMTSGIMELKYFWSSSKRCRRNVGWPHVCLANASLACQPLLIFERIPVTLCSWEIPRWQTRVCHLGISGNLYKLSQSCWITVMRLSCNSVLIKYNHIWDCDVHVKAIIKIFFWNVFLTLTGKHSYFALVSLPCLYEPFSKMRLVFVKSSRLSSLAAVISAVTQTVSAPAWPFRHARQSF